MARNDALCEAPLPRGPAAVKVEVDRTVSMAVNVRRSGHDVLHFRRRSDYCIQSENNDNLCFWNIICEI
jgi:hypothetical protein